MTVAVFHGHVNSSFYVKAVLSPGDDYLLSGSSDGNAYIWQVSRPRSAPRVLRGHVSEVSGVDWCPTDVGRLVTLSDDNVVWIWRLGQHYESSAADGVVTIGRTTKHTGQLLTSNCKCYSAAFSSVKPASFSEVNPA